MCRRTEPPTRWSILRGVAAIAAAAWLFAGPAPAQPAAGNDANLSESPLSSEDVVERYMRNLGLNDLVVAQLQDRLSRAPVAARLPLAERLGQILAVQLRDAQDPDERKRAEVQAEALLKDVPSAQSYDLRLNLGKARYLHAEEIAERARLLLASDAEVAEAIRILAEVRDLFSQVGNSTNRGVEQSERMERRGGDNAAEREAQLAELRRQRSLAMYYAGWSGYYLAELSGQPRLAADAVASFAYLLNASGDKVPSVERLPGSLLQYEHVSRAAVGAALCFSLMGDDASALRWIEVLLQSAEVPIAVRDQLFSRRMIVLSRARRWADVEWSIHRRGRDGTAQSEDGPLSAIEARLLAVLSLQALQTPSSNDARNAIVQSLAQMALGELVRRGEVGHVLDLVRRFDAAVIGEDGFIVRYVDGLGAYEDARKAHADSGDRDTEPTTQSMIASRYRIAAAALRKALDARDASAFSAESSRCAILEGLALYYAGEFETAADRLQIVASGASTEQLREEAMWFAIVALDRATEKIRPSLAARRDELSALFLQTFPASERAARLLIRRGSSEITDPQEAARVLLAVQPGSPLYRAARGHAATLLYRIFRSSRSEQRDFAALQFVDVAEEVVGLERDAAVAADAETMTAISQTMLLRLRQIADALLSMSTPDYSRAQRTLELITQTASAAGISTAEFASELAFRGLQVGLGRGDRAEVERALDELRREGDKYAEAADNLMYREAQKAFAANPNDEALARDLLRFGSRVITAMQGRAGALSDPAVQSVYNRTAEAATFLWTSAQDELARDVAVRLDGDLIAAGVRAANVLRRHAENSEAAGEIEEALEDWRVLLAGIPEGDPDWFEARYNSARVLGLADPRRALAVLDQHASLNPEYGPAPWGERLKSLHAEMRIRAAQAPPATEPDPEAEGGQ